MPLFDLRFGNIYNEYPSRFKATKSYEVYLFFYNNNNFILKKIDIDILDTVHGHPNVEETDIDALSRFAKDQFKLKININKLKFILKDNMCNRYYFYNENLCGDGYKRINSSNYFKYEDYINYFINFNLTTLFCELSKTLQSKQEQRKKRLIKLSLITHNNHFCERCNSYYCICNSKRTRTSSSVIRHRVRC